MEAPKFLDTCILKKFPDKQKYPEHSDCLSILGVMKNNFLQWILQRFNWLKTRCLSSRNCTDKWFIFHCFQLLTKIQEIIELKKPCLFKDLQFISWKSRWTIWIIVFKFFLFLSPNLVSSWLLLTNFPRFPLKILKYLLICQVKLSRKVEKNYIPILTNTLFAYEFLHLFQKIKQIINQIKSGTFLFLIRQNCSSNYNK